MSLWVQEREGALLCLELCQKHRVISPLGMSLYHLSGKVPWDIEDQVLAQEPRTMLQVT